MFFNSSEIHYFTGRKYLTQGITWAEADVLEWIEQLINSDGLLRFCVYNGKMQNRWGCDSDICWQLLWMICKDGGINI